MTGAEDRDRRARRLERRQPTGRGRIGQVIELQLGAATAALAQAGTERVAPDLSVQGLGTALAEQFAGRCNRLLLEMPAADAAEQPVGAERHPGAGLARDRAPGGADGHEHDRSLTERAQQGGSVGPGDREQLHAVQYDSG